jgi:hypothetical protein
MKKILQHWQLILLSFLFVLGSGLRLWKYEYFPVAGETQDEVAWTILGSSLLQTGVPTSWSYFAGYDVLETVTFQANTFQLVQPALDHPPLFSLIPGLVQTLSGHYWKEIPSIKLVRFPIVLLSIMNLFLFAWWLERAVKNPTHKLVSMGIAATAPSIVFLSRLVVSENLLVTWTLLVLLLSTTAFKGWQRWLWLLVHLCLPLTKISGLAISAASLMYNLSAQKKEAFRWALVGTISGVLLFLGYAWYYDFGLFWQIQTQQAQRNTGLLTLFSSWWWSNTLVEQLFADVWNQVGLLALGVFSFLGFQSSKEKKNEQSFILFLFFAQLAFYLLSVGETTVHGWYRLVFWPLWTYALGWLVNYAWQQKNAWWLAFSWLVMAPQIRLGLIFLSGKEAYQVQGSINKIWLVLAGLGIGTLLFPPKWQRRLQQHLWLILAVLLLIAHTATVLGIQHELFWKDALYLQQGIQP